MQVRQSIILYEGGWSTEKIIKLLDLDASSSSVRRALRRNDIQLRTRQDPIYMHDKLDPRLREVVVRLYTEERVPTKKIAHIVKRHPTTVRQMLRRSGVPSWGR